MVTFRSPHLAIQAALLSRLVAALPTTPILDFVPPKQPYPYVRIGDDEMEEWFSKTHGGFEVMVHIDIYSQKPGFKELKTLADAIIQDLTASDLDVTGDSFTALQLVPLQQNYIDLQDGKTRQAALRFRTFVQDAVAS